MTTSGNYSHTYQTWKNCDSVVTAHVTINYSTASNYDTTRCDSYTTPWGQTVTTSGDYSHTYQTSKNCDSVVTAHVTINYSTSSSYSATSCDSYLPVGPDRDYLR